MKEKKEKESAKSVIFNSVDRSIDILEYLFRQGNDTSISQISKDLDIYKRTVFRTLATQENRKYIVQNKNSDQYYIGTNLYAYCRESAMPMENALHTEFWNRNGTECTQTFPLSPLNPLTIWGFHGKSPIKRSAIVLLSESAFWRSPKM